MALLTVGSKGTSVELLQYMIQTTIDGVFGNGTKAALNQFFEKQNLPMRDSVEESFVFEFLAKTELLNITEAKKFVGLKETDVDGDGKGDNRGKEIDDMIRVCFPKFDFSNKTAKGFAWCACFVSYVIQNSYKSLNYKSASAREWLNFAKTHAHGGQLTNTKNMKWDQLYIGGWVNPDGTGHVYFVDPIETLKLTDTSTVATIEGNTNDGGSREGDGVYRRVRNLAKNEVYGIKIR